MAVVANFFLFFVVHSFVLLPVRIKQEGGSDTEIGIVIGVFGFVSVLLRPLAGLLADRVRTRTVALVGVAIVVVTMPLFVLISGHGWQLIALRGLLGVGWACILSPLMALATSLTPTDRLAESLGVYGISGLVSNALAPLVGEWLVARGGFDLLFWADAAVAALSLVLVFAIPQRQLPAEQLAAPASKSNGSGVLWLAVAGTVVLTMAHGAVRGSNLNFIAPFCLQLGLPRASPFFVAFTVAALLTRFKLAALPDRVGSVAVAIPTALLIAGNNLLITRLDSTWLLIVVGLLGGLGQGLIFPALSVLMVKLLGEGRRAFALSIYLTCFELGFSGGLPGFGAIADRAGYRWMYGVAAAVIALATGIFALLVGPLRSREKSTGASRPAC